jgi:LacI family transcriptional regulator
MPRINQQEIAELLKLSQTTVSRSLANHPAINAETKAKVLEAAAKMGYSQRIKRNLPTHSPDRTAIWGVLISMPKQMRGPADTIQETFQEVLRGVADKSSLHNSVLDVVYHDPADTGGADLMRRIRSSKWRGVILIYPVDPALAHEIANQVAAVSIINNYRHDLIDSVDVDQCEAIYSLVSHLKEFGHRRIGFLTWRYTVEVPWVMHRFGNFVEALYRLDLEFSPEATVNLKHDEHFDPPGCARKVADLIERGVTAFVCAADHQAYGLMFELSKLGIRVPEDVSITGFDGINPPPEAPQLATIRVPYEEIGRSATHQLIRRIEQPTAPRRHILVDGDFLSGQTVANPPR